MTAVSLLTTNSVYRGNKDGEQKGLNIGKSVSWLLLPCMTRHERTSSERGWEDYWLGWTSNVRVKGHVTYTGQAEDNRGQRYLIWVCFRHYLCACIWMHVGVKTRIRVCITLRVLHSLGAAADINSPHPQRSDHYNSEFKTCIYHFTARGPT